MRTWWTAQGTLCNDLWSSKWERNPKEKEKKREDLRMVTADLLCCITETK